MLHQHYARVCEVKQARAARDEIAKGAVIVGDDAIRTRIVLTTNKRDMFDDVQYSPSSCTYMLNINTYNSRCSE
ncbi:MAG: hypothetical protein ABJB74_05280 [Gemmatimonas sp.]